MSSVRERERTRGNRGLDLASGTPEGPVPEDDDYTPVGTGASKRRRPTDIGEDSDE